MMIAFAYGIDYIGNSLPRFLIFIVNGLTSAAVGLVALAAYKLGSKILKDRIGIFISTFSCVVSINYSSSWILPALMAFGGIATIVFEFIKKEKVSTTQNPEILDAVQGEDEVSTKGDHYYSKKVGYILFGIWLGMLILALVCKGIVIPRTIDVVATMYYVGSIIFGGGPVVIPLMQNYVVQGNWLSNQEFLIGLAIINSIPGPNFNLSAFCGALALRNSPVMFLGAFLGTIGVFTPGLLLMAAFIPFWRSFRELKIVQTLFQGVNAAAVGLVFSAIYVLSLKSIVLQSGGLSNEVGKLVDYPLYTAISIVTFSSAGFLNLSSPIAILIGGCIGLLDWILQGTQ
jgi:putative chromate ion transporter